MLPPRGRERFSNADREHVRRVVLFGSWSRASSWSRPCCDLRPISRRLQLDRLRRGDVISSIQTGFFLKDPELFQLHVPVGCFLKKTR